MNIIQIFPGKVWGGAEQYIWDLGTALEGAGHRVYWFARSKGAVPGRLQGRIPFTALPFSGLFDMRSADALSMAIEDTGADIVHIHDVRFVPVADRAVRRSGRNVRIVLTIHVARRKKVPVMARPAFKGLHNIIFVSDFAKCRWVSANPWMPDRKCRVVLNSVPEVAGLPCESLREKYNIPEDIPLLVFAGRVRRSKGCAVIAEALSSLRDLPFHMVYIGACKPRNYEKKLAALADRCGIGGRISFYGFTDNARQFVRQADIGLAPSIVKEACHLSPMEFMQAGKCVIASDNGAQTEYLRDMRNGMLVPPGDVQALSSAIRKAITDKALRVRLGEQAGLNFHEGLEYGRYLDRIIACYGL